MRLQKKSKRTEGNAGGLVVIKQLGFKIGLAGIDVGIIPTFIGAGVVAQDGSHLRP